MSIFVPRDEDTFEIDEDDFPAPVRAVGLGLLGIRVYLTEVTPKLAELWLKEKNKNRSIHLSQLNKLKRALEQDRWEINGETIIFDAHGQLIEGQHRLQASLDTGKTFWTLIVVGIDQERFKTMGQGSKRSAGDILSIRGEKNGRNLAAALRWVWRYENHQMMNPHPLITDYELADTIEVHEEIVNSLPYGAKTHGLAAPGLVTALHYLCSQRHKAQANDFFWKFTEGQQLDEGSPILILRNSLMQRIKLRRLMRDEQKAPMIIHAWNLLRKDHNIRLKDARRIAWRHGRTGIGYPTIL